MKAHIETIDGKVTLKVSYDPALCNWDEAMAARLASFGLKQGQAAVLMILFTPPAASEEQNAVNQLLSILQAKYRRIIALPKTTGEN
jgi:hypothetical protein